MIQVAIIVNGATFANMICFMITIICYYFKFFSRIADSYLYGLETMAMTEQQQEKLQVYENNWQRRITGVKIIDKRRMEELMEEVGVRESLTRKLV